MEILGIGPLELLFIFIIILIVLGPKDMIRTGEMLGRYLRKIMTSPTWKLIQDTSRELRYLPNRLARQAGVEEFQKDLQQLSDLPKISNLNAQLEEDWDLGAWTRSPTGPSEPSRETEPLPDPIPQAEETDDQD